MPNYRIASRLTGSGVIPVNTAVLIPAGMGLKLIARERHEASNDVARHLIRLGVPHPHAIRIVRRAHARALETASMRAAEGMGAAGDADPAGQSWLDRTAQIVREYNDSSYDRAAVHSEAQTAMQAISALLSARYDDLSPTMIQQLYTADDTLDKAAKDTLSAVQQSPTAAAAVAFGQQVASEAQAGVKALQKAGQNVVDVATTNWTPWIGGGVALAIAAKLAGVV